MRRILLFLMILFTASTVWATPSADLWARWQKHDPDSTATIDHSAFNAFLQKYVVVHDHGPNGVRYADVSPADKQALDDYVHAMRKIDIDRYNRHVQRAYWTNLYNAETLHRVLDAYPADSIRDIGGGLFSSGPWKKKDLEVEGEKLSLNDIEHRILRPIWADGLTQYGVTCAAMGCPSLRDTAYTGANIDTELRENAADFVNSPQGVTIDDGKVTVSKIYDWYAADFGDNTVSIVSALRRFADPALSAKLDELRRIDGYDFDWTLNDEKHIEAANSAPSD